MIDLFIYGRKYGAGDGMNSLCECVTVIETLMEIESNQTTDI